MPAWRGGASENGPLAGADMALCLHTGSGGKSAEQVRARLQCLIPVTGSLTSIYIKLDLEIPRKAAQQDGSSLCPVSLLL